VALEAFDASEHASPYPKSTLNGPITDTGGRFFGIHSYLLNVNKPVRLTQAELEVNPEWKNF